jgi:hypothetical protein
MSEAKANLSSLRYDATGTEHRRSGILTANDPPPLALPPSPGFGATGWRDKSQRTQKSSIFHPSSRCSQAKADRPYPSWLRCKPPKTFVSPRFCC